MKVVVTNASVDDQYKALRCYTHVLGFVKKTESLTFRLHIFRLQRM